MPASRPPYQHDRPGRLTIEEAAEQLKMSYSGLYRHIRAKTIEHEQDGPHGVITIAAKDLGKIKRARRAEAAGDTLGIFLRPPMAVAKRWKRAIDATTPDGQEPLTLARWLAELAERAAKRAGV